MISDFQIDSNKVFSSQKDWPSFLQELFHYRMIKVGVQFKTERWLVLMPLIKKIAILLKMEQECTEESVMATKVKCMCTGACRHVLIVKLSPESK